MGQHLEVGDFVVIGRTSTNPIRSSLSIVQIMRFTTRMVVVKRVNKDLTYHQYAKDLIKLDKELVAQAVISGYV